MPRVMLADSEIAALLPRRLSKRYATMVSRPDHVRRYFGYARLPTNPATTET
jgi:hypothetical protein